MWPQWGAAATVWSLCGDCNGVSGVSGIVCRESEVEFGWRGGVGFGYSNPAHQTEQFYLYLQQGKAAITAMSWRVVASVAAASSIEISGPNQYTSDGNKLFTSL